LRQIWEVIPDDHFGLNLDPSHLILQLIDYERVIREFADKIFHVHAKDLHIDREGLYMWSVSNTRTVTSCWGGVSLSNSILFGRQLHCRQAVQLLENNGFIHETIHWL
jgi:sugar phosphate isomerase/epimerase